MYLEISSQAVAEKELGCFCFVLFFNKQKPKTKKKTKLGYSSSKWNNPLKSFKENTFKSIFKISHYLRRCSAFCPCSSRGSLKKKKTGWSRLSETILFFKGVQDCCFRSKAARSLASQKLHHRCIHFASAGRLHSVWSWLLDSLFCGPGEGTAQEL